MAPGKLDRESRWGWRKAQRCSSCFGSVPVRWDLGRTDLDSETQAVVAPNSRAGSLKMEHRLNNGQLPGNIDLHSMSPRQSSSPFGRFDSGAIQHSTLQSKGHKPLVTSE